MHQMLEMAVNMTATNRANDGRPDPQKALPLRKNPGALHEKIKNSIASARQSFFVSVSVLFQFQSGADPFKIRSGSIRIRWDPFGTRLRSVWHPFGPGWYLVGT